VRRLHAEANDLIRQAIDMTQRQADLRMKNKQDIDWIESKLIKFEEDDKELSFQLARIKKQFVSRHWEDIVRQFQLMQDHVKTIVKQLPPIAELTTDERQEFEAARSELDRVMENVQDSDSIVELCTNTMENLVSKKNQILEETNSNWNAYQEAVSIVSDNKICFRPDEDIESKKISIEELRKSMSNSNDSKIDLEQYEQAAHDLAKANGEFLRAVHMKLGQLQDVQSLYYNMQKKYRKVYSRVSSSISVRMYETTYDSTMGVIYNLIATGYYEEAKGMLKDVEKMTVQMENEYDAFMRRERDAARAAQKMERQNAERQKAKSEPDQTKSRSSFWGSSTSSSSAKASTSKSTRSNKNSSGGSNWSSGSNKNSSGGANWGSKDKNSSGGSNW